MKRIFCDGCYEEIRRRPTALTVAQPIKVVSRDLRTFSASTEEHDFHNYRCLAAWAKKKAL